MKQKRANAARKPWHLCRELGCPHKTSSRLIEHDPQRRYCANHMPRTEEEKRIAREWMYKHIRPKCRSYPKPKAIWWFGRRLKLDSVIPSVKPYGGCSMDLVSCHPRSGWSLPYKSPPICETIPKVRHTRPKPKEPFYWLIKVKDMYAVPNLLKVGRWELVKRYQAKGIRRLVVGQAQRDAARKLWPEARLIRYYFWRATRNEKRRISFKRRLYGEYPYDLTERMLESARLIRRISSFVLTDGKVLIIGKRETDVDLVARAVGHLVKEARI